MPARSLTALLDAHHDKLNQHTAQLQKIDADVEQLTASVNALENKLSKEDSSSGLRAGLRDWIENIRELM